MKKNAGICDYCGALTREGKRKAEMDAVKHPIHKTDFSRSLSEIIEECRDKLTDVRGTLYDIRETGKWKSQVEDMAGLLTCGLVYLYDLNKDVTRWEEGGGKLGG
jgi:gamma-glutamylcysteine synthetase